VVHFLFAPVLFCFYKRDFRGESECYRQACLYVTVRGVLQSRWNGGSGHTRCTYASHGLVVTAHFLHLAGIKSSRDL